MEVNKRIKKLETEILTINTKLDRIIYLLENNVTKNCDKMNKHITFVESIYENVKNPLGFFCRKINYFISNEEHKFIENNI